MSEYQWVHFLAIDSPLSDDQLEFMQDQSSRASINRWSFTNEYSYGDFHGDAEAMLKNGYDVHLHFASYGIRTLQFRLPQLPCESAAFKLYAIEDELTWQKDRRGDAGILTVCPEGDAGTWESYLPDVDSMLERIAPVREMLIRGDLRPLYLFWLATCYEEDQMEPPVPAGLGEMGDVAEAIAEFFEIPDNVIQTAVAGSGPAPQTADTDQVIRKWLGRQKKAELLEISHRLLTGDLSARLAVLNQIHQHEKRPNWPVSPASRTFGQLRQATD
jgi:hypothetical protein